MEYNKPTVKILCLHTRDSVLVYSLNGTTEPMTGDESDFEMFGGEGGSPVLW